jgi:phospholipase C
MALKDINTFVIVLMENRSFDHMLGYLSTAAINPPLPVEGLHGDAQWLIERFNYFHGEPVPIHPLTPATQSIEDPPHEAATIAIQINTSPRPNSPLQMGGFVESYMQRQPPPITRSLVMGYYEENAVPIFDLFAHKFTVCDHWFAALPTGTQANRLMAMSGSSSVVDNAPVFLPDQELVYDWLSAHEVNWCAYQSGDFFPFFRLMPRWLPEILTSLAASELGVRGRFRRYSKFREHWLSDDAMPSVIFVEPEYTDGPNADPNDDHPPTGIAKGQAFLADIYNVLISKPERWRDTMMIVTYDEHGGFFDHVRPIEMPTDVAGHRFTTMGVRVPAFVISPHVAPGIPFTGLLDHTSILQMLAERFNPGGAYSAAVAARQTRLSRLSATLSVRAPADLRTPAVPPLVMEAVQAAAAGAPVPTAIPSRAPGATANAMAFNNVALKVAREHPDLLKQQAWSAVSRYLAAQKP